MGISGEIGYNWSEVRSQGDNPDYKDVPETLERMQ